MNVGFESELGVGSRFWIDIPAAAGSSAASKVAAAAKTLLRKTEYLVLYVEDNPSNRNLVRSIFTTIENVRLMEAADGATGIAMAKEHHPDLIILDIHLPDINGFAVLQQLKRLPEFAATPFIALTADAMKSQVAHGLEAGFTRYLTKPIDMHEFLVAINASLPLAIRSHQESAAPAPEEKPKDDALATPAAV